MKHSSQLRLAMAQINVVVGDVEGNAQKILDWIDRAREVGAEIVTFPELALTGYPPEDLLLKPQFIDANLVELEKIVSRTRGVPQDVSPQLWGFRRVSVLPAGQPLPRASDGWSDGRRQYL